MNKKIVINYIALTYLISWAFFIGAKFLSENMQMPLLILGAFGPFLAVLATLKIHDGNGYTTDFKKSMLKWKSPVIWYLFPLAIVFILQIGDAAGQVMLGTTEFSVAGLKQVYMLLPLILMMVIGGGQEEIGWRGLLLPELLKKYPPVASSLIVGIAWAMWHIPLFFIEGLPQYGQNFASFTLGCVNLSLYMTFLYRKTESALISGYWFHMVANGVTGYFNLYLLKEQTPYIEWAYALVIVPFIIIGIFINKSADGFRLRSA